MFGYELPPEEGADWCRFMNEELLSGVRQLDALAPLACVPLQSGKPAAVGSRKLSPPAFTAP